MGKRILVVDDNPELLALLRINLKAAGFSTSTASNGVTALKKARSRSPDVIVLDLMMPDMDGFAVCEALKQHPKTGKVPVIVLTGLTSQFARLHGLAAGAVEFISKPIRPQQLIERINDVLLKASPCAS